MEEKVLKNVTVILILLTVFTFWMIPNLNRVHTWAVEQQEDLIAVEEQEDEKIEMSSLEIKDTVVTDEAETRQLRLTLPEGVSGSRIKITNNYVTQTVTIEIPQTTQEYFSNYPISGSSNHIDSLFYTQEQNSGKIEIAMDQVYELEMNYDDSYYYFDFLTPHEVYDKVVVIDAGHGGRAPGATKQGIKEKNIDLAIVLELKKIFDEDDTNIGVYYTRTDDSNPTFDQRVQLANKSQADLFISVHNNSTGSGRMSSTSGTQVMYSETDEAELGSKLFAQICLEEVTEGLKSKNKGLVAGDSIYIIRTSEVPVALIEVGFMTNQTELDLLNSQEYQQQAAESIYRAIMRAFEEGY